MEGAHLLKYFDANKNKKELEKKEVNDDDWGDLTNVFNMLSNELNSCSINEKMGSMEDIDSLSLQKPKEETDSLLFGEYQPSCLSSKRRVVHGRRRITNPSPKRDNFHDEIEEGKQVSTELLLQSTNGGGKKTNREEVLVPDISLIHAPIKPNQLQKNGSKSTQDELQEQDDTRSSEDLNVKPKRSGSSRFESSQDDQSMKEKVGLPSKFDSWDSDAMKIEESSLLSTPMHVRSVQKSSEEFSNASLALKELEQEKKSQNLAAMLAAEIQFLKDSSKLAQEKLQSLETAHHEEVNMLKHIDNSLLEANEKHVITKTFLSEESKLRDTVTELMEKAKDWSSFKDSLQAALSSIQELLNDDRIKCLGALESTVSMQQVCLHEWGNKSSESLSQVQKLIDVVEYEIKNVKEIYRKENERLTKEYSHIQSLQNSLQLERVQLQADLSASHAKLEEIHEKCFQEKETCLKKCCEERKELLAEKEAILQMKEQLYQADAALEKKSLEHLSLMQSETTELSNQRLELERARVMAAEIVQEVEERRREIEIQCHALKVNSFQQDCIISNPQRKGDLHKEPPKVCRRRKVVIHPLKSMKRMGMVPTYTKNVSCSTLKDNRMARLQD